MLARLDRSSSTSCDWDARGDIISRFRKPFENLRCQYVAELRQPVLWVLESIN